MKKVLPLEYPVLVLGTYLPEMSGVIKAKLTDRLLRIISLVVGKSAKHIVLVVPEAPSALGSLVLRTARALRLDAVTAPDSELSKARVVLMIKLEPEEGVNEELVAKLESEYDKLQELVSNAEPFEIVVPVTKKDLERPYPVQTPGLPPVQPGKWGYDSFDKVKDFRDKVTREEEPTVTRDNIPAYGPGVTPDMGKASGLQTN